MKKDVKVSIIVPIYNGEEFIDKCLDSLLNQTYENIEIILSDDGSSDNSLKLIKKYASKYKNIKYDTHSNSGQSITRNMAFKNVTGDYVTFLDVDDYLDNDFIERMLLANDNNDIIIGGYRRVYPSGKIDFEYSLNNTIWNRYRRVTVWAKLYKVSFLKKNKIKYPDISLFGEDVVYTMRCLSKTDNVKITNYIGYNNLINEKSLTHKNKDRIKNDVPKMYKYIDIFIGNNKTFLTKNKKYVKYYLLKIFVAYLQEQTTFLEYDDLVDYYKVSYGKLKEIYKKYDYKLSFLWQSDEPIKVNLLINLFVLFEKLHLAKWLIWLLSKTFYQKNKK